MSAVANPEVDSRAYAFVYPIRGREHVPADFPVSVDFDRMVAGIFLPQDQSGWFSKSRYPARILVLLPGVLVVATHPSSGEPTVRVRNGDIVAIEVARSLLDGRVTVHTSGASHQCRYNTRDGRHVDEFFFKLRQLTMPEPESLETMGVRAFGPPLDLKFAAAEASELDAGEPVLVRFFSPPKQSIDTSWFIANRSWRSGDYVGITSRRAIWITDRSGGHRSVYGTTSVYAGLRRLSEIALTPGGGKGGCELVLSLVGHPGWRVPISPELREQARLFVDQVQGRGPS